MSDDGDLFKGKTFVIVGRLETMTRDEAWLKIMQLGGYTSKTPRPSSDVFVMGTSTSAAREAKARALNKKMLTEQEFLDAIARLETEHQETREVVPVSDAIGEFRALFDGPPTQEVWAQLCALLDSCAPERLEDVVGYVEAQLARWPAGMDRAVAPIPSMWLDALGQAGELRVSGYGWQQALLRGESSPKYRLLRALDLRGYPSINGTVASKITTNPSLSGLRALDVGRGNDKLTQTFYKKLFASEHLPALEQLTIRKLDARIAAAIAAQPTTLTTLRRVELSCPEQYGGHGVVESIYSALFEVPWWSQIEGLAFSLTSSGYLIDQGQFVYDLLGRHLGRMTALRGLTLHDGYALDALVNTCVLGQLSDVRLTFTSNRDESMRALAEGLASEASSVRTLDLSLTYRVPGHTYRTTLARVSKLLAALLEAGVHERVETIVLPEALVVLDEAQLRDAAELDLALVHRQRAQLAEAGVQVVTGPV